MEYITIAEFAELAGVTPQAIHKRTSKDLAPYIDTSTGKKRISTDALKLFEVSKPIEPSPRVEELEAEVERLTQLNNELNQRFIEQNDKFLEILAIQAKQAENYQILLAQNQSLQQQLLNPPQPVEEEKEVSTVEEDLTPVVKRGFFSRLFKKAP